MSWLSSWLHPERGYQAGQEQLDKYYNQGQGYLNPYSQGGQQAFNPLMNQMQQLMDPQALQDKWAKGYKESEAAKGMEGMAQQHGLDAASSMGLMGSSPAISAIQAGTSQIGAQDRQNYMNDLMQKYQAATGIGQNLYGIGANAAGQQSQNAMNMGQQSAGMQFGQTNAPGQMFGQGVGYAGNLLSRYLTGGSGGGKNVWSSGGG